MCTCSLVEFRVKYFTYDFDDNGVENEHQGN